MIAALLGLAWGIGALAFGLLIGASIRLADREAARADYHTADA